MSSAKKFCPKVSGKGKSGKSGSRNSRRKINEEKYRSGHNEPHSKCGCPQGHVGSNPTFSANKACNCNGYRLLNFLEIAVFTRFSVGRTAEYPGRTSAIFEKYRLYRIENRNYIQQFFHLLSKQLSSGNSSIFVIASAEEIFDE